MSNFQHHVIFLLFSTNKQHIKQLHKQKISTKHYYIYALMILINIIATNSINLKSSTHVLLPY